MRIVSLFVFITSIAGLGWADSVPPCPSTVTSCSFSLSPGASGSYQVSFDENPAPFWETRPESGWPPIFRLILSPSELASGQLPYNVEYDFAVGIDLANTPPGASGQVTVDFQLPASVTDWVVVGFQDPYGGNAATLLTSSGGQTGAGYFYAGPGGAYVLTAVPGELIVTSNYTPGNVGDTVFTGILIGETVPEPQTGWLVLAGGLIAGGAWLTRRRKCTVQAD